MGVEEVALQIRDRREQEEDGGGRDRERRGGSGKAQEDSRQKTYKEKKGRESHRENKMGWALKFWKKKKKEQWQMESGKSYVTSSHG